MKRNYLERKLLFTSYYKLQFDLKILSLAHSQRQFEIITTLDDQNYNKQNIILFEVCTVLSVIFKLITTNINSKYKLSYVGIY